jgi:hypothetical protein
LPNRESDFWVSPSSAEAKASRLLHRFTRPSRRHNIAPHLSAHGSVWKSALKFCSFRVLALLRARQKLICIESYGAAGVIREW